MIMLKEICKKDGRYKEVIRESPIVKNAIILFGGRRTEDGKEEGEGDEKEEELGEA